MSKTPTPVTTIIVIFLIWIVVSAVVNLMMSEDAGSYAQIAVPFFLILVHTVICYMLIRTALVKYRRYLSPTRRKWIIGAIIASYVLAYVFFYWVKT